MPRESLFERAGRLANVSVSRCAQGAFQKIYRFPGGIFDFFFL